MRAGYWMVKWGHEIRINAEKTDNMVAACKQCYGMATPDMEVKFISTRVSDVRNLKRRRELESNPKGWESPCQKSVY